MIITEAELRAYWQNGRGNLPDFPPGTRFTPAALDFLKANGLNVSFSAAPAARAPLAPVREDGKQELKALPGQRLILTTGEVADLLSSGVKVLVVFPSVTITDSARERLRSAGVRLIPGVESSAPGLVPARPQPASPAPDTKPAPEDDELFCRVKAAVLARLAGGVDEALLDAVLRRVLAEAGVQTQPGGRIE